MARCTAKSKQSGERCKRHAVPGRNVCAIHGGKTPRGFALPQSKTLKYGASLPTRLKARYEESERDPELLYLRDDIAVVDARLEDLIKRVDTGESGALWEALHRARQELILAKRSGDSLKQMQWMNAILELIGQGHSDYQAWREIGGVLEQRRRLVESERKRLVEMQQMITTEKAMLLIGAVVGIIKDNVKDPVALAAISTGIDLILESGHDG